MMLTNTLKKVALVAMLFATGVANATVYQFNVSGAFTAQFQIDTNAVPDGAQNGVGLSYLNQAVVFAGGANGAADISFYNLANGGGLQLNVVDSIDTYLSTNGPQLYTGLEESGMIDFLVGTFALSDFDPTSTGTYTVTVMDQSPGAAVPEPATGAMLFGGLAIMAALRKRRHG